MSSRPFIGSYVRKNVVLKTRNYARLNTALPRAMTALLTEGQPGDTFELASREFGFQIATIRVHVGGKFTVSIVGDSE